MRRLGLHGLSAAGALALGSLVTLALAQSNIDNTVPDKYAWAENVGWTNWFDAGSGAQGVNVGNKVLSGYIWGQNIGWINVGDGTPGGTNGQYVNATGSDFGINVNADGTLHGYAWGENVGWINFDGGAAASPAQPARILCSAPPSQPLARLTGFAWGENIGWLNLSVATAGQYVAVNSATTPITCDLNHDGLKNGRDIQTFANLLLGGGANWRDICSGDLSGNGTLDMSDVSPFVTCLLTAP